MLQELLVVQYRLWKHFYDGVTETLGGGVKLGPSQLGELCQLRNLHLGIVLNALRVLGNRGLVL